MSLSKEISDKIEKASAAAGNPMINGVDFYIEYQPLNHKPKSLPKGKMAVYMFVYKGVFLKIGQANINSKARYQSHHYHIKSGKSTLANSLIADPTMNDILVNVDITDWIRQNCERFDVIIDGTKHNKLTLNFVEGLLHYFYKPKYEEHIH